MRYIERDGLLCDDNHAVCLRAWLSYEPNPRLLRLRGRVQSATGPGLLKIILAGTNRNGDRRYTPMEIRLRGRYSEIVDYKMIPDHPDVDNWQIDTVSFIDDEDSD
jgi:hypothetical protein